MGRSFLSVRMGVKEITGRWERAARAMRDDDARYAGKVVTMAKEHSSEAFYSFSDPLEAALFSVLIGICRELDQEASQETLPGMKNAIAGTCTTKCPSCRPAPAEGKKEGLKGGRDVDY